MDDLRIGLSVAFSIIIVNQYFIHRKLDKILKDKSNQD